MLSETETQQFQNAYREYESGDIRKALEYLRGLVENAADPIDKMGLLYHEVSWLTDISDLSEARDRLDILKGLMTTLADASPADQAEFAPDITLTVMGRFVEAKLLLAEGHRNEGVAILNDLVEMFPRQLSNLPREIYDYIQLNRGYFLSNKGRWKETISALESISSPPESERGHISYYLGHSYYMLKDYPRAKMRLADALRLGLGAKWECRAHYMLGLAEYHLSNFGAAKREFEKCLETADQEYLSSIKISEWLEAASRRSELDEDPRHNRVQ